MSHSKNLKSIPDRPPGLLWTDPPPPPLQAHYPLPPTTYSRHQKYGEAHTIWDIHERTNIRKDIHTEEIYTWKNNCWSTCYVWGTNLLVWGGSWGLVYLITYKIRWPISSSPSQQEPRKTRTSSANISSKALPPPLRQPSCTVLSGVNEHAIGGNAISG